MKRVIKIFIDVKDEDSVQNLKKEDVVKLQNIFEGDITQIVYSKNLCENCESRAAGVEYCEDCKSNEYNLFAIKEK